MAIEFTDENEFVGVWFAPTPGGDFMAAVFRKRGDRKWQLCYRFRYYNDNVAHGSEDRKSWWKATFDGDAAPARQAIESMCSAMGMKFDFVDLTGVDTAVEMMARLAKMPWAHIRHEASA
jgi:hypothetical protein